MNEIPFSEDMEQQVINRLCSKNHAAMKRQGFWDRDTTVPDFYRVIYRLALIHTEISEMVEALRDGKHISLILEELADVIIRGFDLAGHYEWDLGEAIIKKMEKNAKRPYMHGKKH